MDKLREMQILLAKIPKGKISTYKILAKKLKVHPRTAGILLSQNTDGIRYPCYKIVSSSGKVGGYSGCGGVKRKVQLLKKDGIEFKNKKIDLRKYVFDF
jgi:O6-methylguanine-DNA--protein-cysteine methyltransferase